MREMRDGSGKAASAYLDRTLALCAEYTPDLNAKWAIKRHYGCTNGVDSPQVPLVLWRVFSSSLNTLNCPSAYQHVHDLRPCNALMSLQSTLEWPLIKPDSGEVCRVPLASAAVPDTDLPTLPCLSGSSPPLRSNSGLPLSSDVTF